MNSGKDSTAVAPVADGNTAKTNDAKTSDYQVITVHSPYIMMYSDGNDGVTCRIHPPKGYTYEHYGLLVCDLVRHIARAFEVNEEAVWEWVGRERRNPTTEITIPS